MHVSICQPQSHFNRMFVCVGVGPVMVELSITQCCWLLELISPSLCFCLGFMSCIFFFLLYCRLINVVLHLLISSLPFVSPCILHFSSPFLSSTSYSLLPSFSLYFLRFLGRVWLWFRNQSQASWFHVVSHLSSQCLVCYIHILLQGKNIITRKFGDVGHKQIKSNSQSLSLCFYAYFHQYTFKLWPNVNHSTMWEY